MSGALRSEIEDFLTHLTVEKGRSTNTLAAYRRDLARYTDFLGAQDVRTVDVSSVIEFQRSCAASGLAQSSTNRTMAAVRGLHRFLLAEGLASSDPTADVERRGLPASLPKPLSESEIVALIDSTEGTAAADLRDRSIIELLYGTGARISELTTLSLTDIDLAGDLIRVTGKGDKQRLVPIGRMARSALMNWLSPSGRPTLIPDRWATREAENALYLNRRGGRLSRQGAWNMLKKRGASAGIGNKLSPHVLRHSCATHMLDHGADIRTVQELLGHASVSTTQLYTRVANERIHQEYRRTHPRATFANRPDS